MRAKRTRWCLTWRFVLVWCGCMGLVHATSPTLSVQTARRQLLGSWEQGSCDAEGIICSQLTLTFHPDGRVTWSGYPKIQYAARYAVAAVEGDRVTVHFSKTTGDLLDAPHDSVFQLDPAAQMLTEVQLRRGTIVVARNVRWKRGEP